MCVVQLCLLCVFWFNHDVTVCVKVNAPVKGSSNGGYIETDVKINDAKYSTNHWGCAVLFLIGCKAFHEAVM